MAPSPDHPQRRRNGPGTAAPTAVLPLLAVSMVLTACGSADDDGRDQRPSFSLPVTTTPAEAERQQRTPPPVVAEHGPPATSRASSAERVAIRFAMAEINWTWRDPQEPWQAQRRLATGPLLAEIDVTRPTDDAVRSLEGSQSTSRGEVVTTTSRPRRDGTVQVYVVVRERVGEHGSLEPYPRVVVRRALVRRTGSAWRVERWDSLPS